MKEWLGTEPAPPTLEVEGFLRMLLGDQGTQEILDTGGQFPQRLHLVETTVSFFDGFYRLLIECCEESLAQLDEWPDTRDIGWTPQGREHFQRLLEAPDP